jgi:hypothetical protein
MTRKIVKRSTFLTPLPLKHSFEIAKSLFSWLCVLFSPVKVFFFYSLTGLTPPGSAIAPWVEMLQTFEPNRPKLQSKFHSMNLQIIELHLYLGVWPNG